VKGVIRMKKKLSVILVLLLLFAAPVVNAANQEQQRIQDPESHTSDTQEVTVTREKLQSATENLNRVVTRTNNPEVGEQIRTMAENHVRVQERVETALSRIDSRGRFLKFVFGPDYKNAGEVRGQIAEIQGDIEELTAIKDDLTYTDQQEVQDAIDNLESEAETLTTELDQKLEGFSLFGWLNRLLSRY